MQEAGVVRLGDGESSAKGRRGKSEGEDGTSISRNDGGVSEKVNLGGSTFFVVNVRALHNLTVDFREVRLEKSYGTGALDDLEACLRAASSLVGQFCGEDATEEKEGEFPGEYLLRLGVSLSFGLEAGRLGVDSWQGTGPWEAFLTLRTGAGPWGAFLLLRLSLEFFIMEEEGVILNNETYLSRARRAGWGLKVLVHALVMA